MEQLSIASFLRNGHEYHLYVYDELKNIPVGVTVQNANEILPASMIFQYKDYPSYSGFSNFFRYKLLLDRGGWWVDTDTICLKAFEFSEEYVISSEMVGGVEMVSSGIIKAPVGSHAMAYAWKVCQSKNPAQLAWGETGPRLMAEVVTKYSLERFKKPANTFCPLGYLDWHKVLEGDGPALDESSYAVHLWNEMWRKTGQDKNAQYAPECTYEKLKTKYLGDYLSIDSDLSSS